MAEGSCYQLMAIFSVAVKGFSGINACQALHMQVTSVYAILTTNYFFSSIVYIKIHKSIRYIHSTLYANQRISLEKKTKKGIILEKSGRK